VIVLDGPFCEAHAKDPSQIYLGSIRRGVLKTMGGGGVSVCVADKIEQSRKGLRTKQRLLEAVSRRSRGIRGSTATATKL